MKNQVDFGTKLASFILIFSLLGNDLFASTRAIMNHHFIVSKNVKQKVNSVLFSVEFKSDGNVSNEKALEEGADASSMDMLNAPLISGSVALLGTNAKDPLNLPKDDFFEFEVPEGFEDYEYAILKYEVNGLRDALSVPKSINSYPAYEGSEFVKSDEWKFAKVSIDKGLLKTGVNTVRFGMPEGFSSAVFVRNVSLSFANNRMGGVSLKQTERFEADIENFNLEDRIDSDRLWVLKDFDMPSVPSDVRNVTLGGVGYYLQSASKDSARITLSYRTDLVPSQALKEGLGLYYFNHEKKIWEQAIDVAFDPMLGEIQGTAPSNTDYFAGLISTPEMPEASAFVPTAISDIKAANPGTGIHQINPPSVSRNGDASISYPIEVPKGRGGMTPNLSLHYSSDNGTGWLGVGWSIQTPNISVDTRWGVPDFGANETEGYVLNGEPLFMEGGKRPNKTLMPSRPSNGEVRRFYQKTMHSYKTVERRGTGVDDYFWVETLADGTTYYYGTRDGINLSGGCVQTNGTGKIIKWYLGRVVDKWGNYINYSYDQGIELSSAFADNGGRYMVLSGIEYTGKVNGDSPFYRVEFHSSKNRKDATIDLKAGVKVVDYHRLDKIEVYFDDPVSGDELVYNYEFNYIEGDFGKTLLKNVRKNVAEENGVETDFYKYVFDYHRCLNQISYSSPVTISAGVGGFANLLEDMGEDLGSTASTLSKEVEVSTINTSTTNGWGSGGSVGLGITLISGAFIPDKTMTFSGHLNYEESTTNTKISLNDFNGDGLPDLVYDAGYGLAYSPLEVNGTQPNFGNLRPIVSTGALSNTDSYSMSYGFDFPLPLDALYFGMNWNETTSITTKYLSDYNADGFPDLVNGGQVYFGDVSSNGDFQFNVSSEFTHNPVLKGQDAQQPGNVEPIADFQIVKVWEAPASGIVDIDGVASCDIESLDGVYVGIQFAGGFIKPMTQILSSGDVEMKSGTSGVSVIKGQKIYFRVQAQNNGYDDLVLWNPQVTYREVSLVDANGINYGNTSYEDGFLLSANDGIIVNGGRLLKVVWPSLPGGLTFTDDVTFRVNIFKNGENTYYDKKVAAGTPVLLDGNFVNPDNEVAPFLSSFASIPNATSADECTMSFQVFSKSNIKWKDINWRPEVQFTDDPCKEPFKTRYPVVYYRTFNRLIRMDGPYSPSSTGGGTDKMRMWPSINMSNCTSVFTQDELNAGLSKHAWVVVKTSGALLTKMILKINTDGSYGFYSDASFIEPVDLNSSSSLYSFNRGNLNNNEIYLGFYGEDKAIGDFLAANTSSIRYVNVSSAPVQEGTTENFEVFAIDRTEFHDNWLGWGQFCWNDNLAPTSLMTPSTIQMDKTMADYTDDYHNNEPDEAELRSHINESTETMIDLKFHPLIPRRGEQQKRLPNNVYSTYANGGYYELDCWSAWNGKCGSYSSQGATVPGKFMEPKPELLSAPSSNPYTATGTKLKSYSYSLSDNLGPISLPGFPMGYSKSKTLNGSPGKYNTQTISQFIDINGDNYPDVLIDEDDPKMQLTSPLGGLGNQTNYFTQDVDYGLAIPMNETNAISGQYANDDVRFQGGVSSIDGEDDTKSEWIDMNGDGLPDRVRFNNNLLVQYNKAKGLESEIYLPITGYTANEISKSETNAKSLSTGLGGLNTAVGRAGMSFSAGIGINASENEVFTKFIDFNGDNLVDLAWLSPNGMFVYINLGTKWDAPIAVSSSLLGKSESTGISANIGATVGMPLAIYTFIALKLALQGSYKDNFAINATQSTLKDMNGDGLLDIVENAGFGKINVQYADINKSNLLKKVENPLGGNFEIEYQKVGNKYGMYPVEIKTEVYVEDEVMVWDMPYSKWVMSKLTINDGLDINSGSADLDGDDDLEFTFKYDGGIKSRRNRDFLGFARIQKISEPTKALPITNIGDETFYTSNITEYFRVLGNSPEEIRKLDFYKGVPIKISHLYHKEWVDDDITTGEIIINSEMKVISQTKNKYELREVLQSGGSIGELKVVNDDFVVVDENNLIETQCVFPALIGFEEISFPDYEDQDNLHLKLYELRYDKYANVVWYSRRGSDVLQQVNQVVTGSIDQSEYIYHSNIDYTYDDLLAKTFPFEIYTYDPIKDKYCFTIKSMDPGYEDYEDLVLCVSGYEFASNECNSSSTDNRPFELVFRKLVPKEIAIVEKEYIFSYHAPIIAKMEYFQPSAPVFRTNALKSHKIYLGSENPGDFVRGTLAVLEGASGNKLDVGTIYNCMNENLSTLPAVSAETNITYDSYGNVLTVTGPKNHKGQRLVTNFEYETTLNQMVQKVSNSYGDETCYKYDLKTGNLLRQVGINGHATAYEYDDYQRLISVYGPREYADPNSAPTISFDYHLEGLDGGTVPVAITNHNMDVSELSIDNPITIDCASDDDFSARPTILQPLQTATFVDGLQRVVQIKKDAASHTNTGGYVTTRVREVSGITEYDRWGRDARTSLSVLEDPTVDPIGVLNTNKSGSNQIETTYDWLNRPISTNSIREGGAYTATTISYIWQQGLSPMVGDHFSIEQEVNSSRTTKSFVNSIGQTFANIVEGTDINPQFTQFEYDELGQLINSIDPVKLVTSYQYDAFGRMTQETHPDRKLSKFTYDMAGNLINHETVLSGTTGISYEYEYNRILKRVMPTAQSAATYDLEYTWGTSGDGKNGAGRVTRVEQGANVWLVEDYGYDELGNRTTENKQFYDQTIGNRVYNFSYAYDSWGRMREITYADGEEVSYAYAPTGELQSISSFHAVSSPQTESIVDNIYYDGFGNIARLEYGNGTVTNYTYDAYSKRLSGLNLTSGSLTTMLDKSYGYDPYGNVNNVSNIAMAYNPIEETVNSVQFGAQYTMQYQYDAANRLKGMGSSNFGGETFGLTMEYDEAGGITDKIQTYTNKSYTLKYTPKNASHQIEYIEDLQNGSGPTYVYEYDNMGNVEKITEGSNVENFYWNELNYMQGADNSGGVYHYLYDQNGERVWKGIIRSLEAGTNEGLTDGNVKMDGNTLYVNPYYVVNNYAQTDEGSKHYYMGMQRVGSAVMSYTITNFQLWPPESYNPNDARTPGSIVDLGNLLEAKAIRNGTTNEIDLSTLLQPISYDDYMNFDDYQMAVAELPVNNLENRCKLSIYWTQNNGESCEADKIMYWYHPDYLGNVEYVTNKAGEPHEYFWYSPWGEPLEHHDMGSTFSSRYKFNAKELDEETGNYYYGARYYNPQTSIWLSVDPMADQRPSLTPYNFVSNNPIMRVDPTGMIDVDWAGVLNYIDKATAIELDEVVVYNPGPTAIEVLMYQASEYYDGLVVGGELLRENIISTANDLIDGDPDALRDLLSDPMGLGQPNELNTTLPGSAYDAGVMTMGMVPAFLLKSKGKVNLSLFKTPVKGGNLRGPKGWEISPNRGIQHGGSKWKLKSPQDLKSKSAKSRTATLDKDGNILRD